MLSRLLGRFFLSKDANVAAWKQGARAECVSSSCSCFKEHMCSIGQKTYGDVLVRVCFFNVLWRVLGGCELFENG